MTYLRDLYNGHDDQSPGNMASHIPVLLEFTCTIRISQCENDLVRAEINLHYSTILQRNSCHVTCSRNFC